MNIEKMKEITMTCLKVIFFTLYLKYKIWNPELKKMTYSQLHDEIMAIFLAGHETTSNALTWTFYLLSKHPAVASRLFEETSTILTNIDENSKQIFETVEDIPKLEYTEKILSGNAFIPTSMDYRKTGHP